MRASMTCASTGFGFAGVRDTSVRDTCVCDAWGVWRRRFLLVLFSVSLVLFSGLGGSVSSAGDVADVPASSAEKARLRVRARIEETLAKVRLLAEMTPNPAERPQCALLLRPEKWLHVPGRTPYRTMSLAAAVAAAADSLGWDWSHSLRSPVLWMDLDFGPARRSMTGAEWICEVDRLTGGNIEIRMYPATRHLYVLGRRGER